MTDIFQTDASNRNAGSRGRPYICKFEMHNELVVCEVANA